MERIDIKGIKFGSFTKFVCIISTMLGITLGLLLFVLSLFGGNVYANIGSLHFTGVTAGVFNVFLCPVILALFGLLGSLLSYLPFKLYFKVFKKVIIYGRFEGYQVTETSISSAINKKEVNENNRLD